MSTTVSTTESIRSWLLQCPTISNLVEFYADYTGETPKEAMIYTLPSALNFTEDVCGNISYEGEQVLQFIFALSVPYSNDTLQSLENIAKFSDIKNWMEAQNKLKNLPTIEEGLVKSIMPIKTECLSEASPDIAIYEMQCALTYWKE